MNPTYSEEGNSSPRVPCAAAGIEGHRWELLARAEELARLIERHAEAVAINRCEEKDGDDLCEPPCEDTVLGRAEADNRRLYRVVVRLESVVSHFQRSLGNPYERDKLNAASEKTFAESEKLRFPTGALR